MTNVQVECVVPADNWLGETPIWVPQEQALYWVNCEKPAEILRWEAASGELVRWAMPQRVGGIAYKERAGLLVVLGDGLYDLQKDGQLTKRVDSPFGGKVLLHECATDRQGRLWVGAYDHNFNEDRSARGGAYCRLDGNRLTPVIEGIAVANGLAFSPDGRTMYAADSATRSVQSYPLDPATGAVGAPSPFLTLPVEEGFVDGATVDATGGYWLALVGGSKVRRYLPNGAVDRDVELPCSNPTKPVFGGVDLDIMYVTSTNLPIRTDALGFAQNGGVFACRVGVRGLSDTPVAE